MCGVCGYVGQGSKQLLHKMQRAMKHRGPDEDGCFVQTGVGLGHRRLSIIDLHSGQQPMTNETADIWITYNGEIYNFLALKRELEAKGHQFRTSSDTEVIIHAYEEWGDDCLHHFRGMFVFALWDGVRQRLFIARDRLGIKPLYYTVVENTLLFASEMKALLQYPDVNRSIAPLALDRFLRLQYIPAPDTIFENVFKLPAAHTLVWERNQLQVSRYWSLNFQPQFRDETEWLDALEAKIEESVRLRLIADVPLGAFLSGGIDSSIVVLTMARLLQEPVQTFAIGFESERYDERPFAQQIATLANTNHHETVVLPHLCSDLFSQLVRQLDEPMSDASFIPTYFVSQLARQKVTVALSGDGGDETFAGYSKYARWLQWQSKIGRVPPLRALTPLQPFVKKLPMGQRTMTALIQEKIGRYAELTYRYYSRSLNGLYRDEWKQRLTAAQSQTPDLWQEMAVNANYQEPIAHVQQADYLTYLPEDILMKVDKMSMLTSLEVRVPLLDHELQELAAHMPAHLKLRDNVSKYILKQLLTRWGLPDSFIHRRKTGFSPTLSYWFADDWQNHVVDELKDGYAVQSGILAQKGIDHILEQKDAIQLWNLWIFETWAKSYL